MIMIHYTFLLNFHQYYIFQVLQVQKYIKMKIGIILLGKVNIFIIVLIIFQIFLIFNYNFLYLYIQN